MCLFGKSREFRWLPYFVQCSVFLLFCELKDLNGTICMLLNLEVVNVYDKPIIVDIL